LYDGRDVAQALREHPGYGLLPVGYILARPDLAPGELDLPVLGQLADVSSVVAEHGITLVIVGRTIAEEGALIEAIRECDRMRVEVFVVTGLTDLMAGATAEHI
jgi:FlaA1/EpsC-like NDP-sugar epimerase